MATKVVLLFGVLAVALLLLHQALPLDISYIFPGSARHPGSLFSGLGQLSQAAIGCGPIYCCRTLTLS